MRGYIIPRIEYASYIHVSMHPIDADTHCQFVFNIHKRLRMASEAIYIDHSHIQMNKIISHISYLFYLFSVSACG